MKPAIDQRWQQWIDENIARGCDRYQMAAIMRRHGFDPAEVAAALGIRADAAPPDEAAEAQRQERQQPLAASFYQHARRIDTDKAEVYLLENFLGTRECEQVIHRIHQNLRPSAITNPAETDQYFRTSQTCDLGLHADEFIKQVDARIAAYLNRPLSASEALQGQYYQVGNEFKAHTDYFQPGTSEYERFAAGRGQRTWTFMVYLNDVEAGGDTEFPRLGVSVKPARGLALVWSNLDQEGQVNRNTLHWAKPVEAGTKYVITKWFRLHAG